MWLRPIEADTDSVLYEVFLDRGYFPDLRCRGLFAPSPSVQAYIHHGVRHYFAFRVIIRMILRRIGMILCELV